ncbi:hypothetical protein [Brasilonema sennae]|nr:hypothetical protein [Brasilonema sennae]
MPWEPPQGAALGTEVADEGNPPAALVSPPTALAPVFKHKDIFRDT